MEWETVYNPGDTPRPRDGEGRVVGSRSWAPARVDDPGIAEDIAAGRLRVVDTPDPVPGGLAPDAEEAMRETLRNRQRAGGRKRASAAAADNKQEA